MTIRPGTAELEAAPVEMTVGEAVALVSDLCREVTHGTLRGIPSAAVLRRGTGGTFEIRGPVSGEPPFVRRAALLLNDLLPALDAAPERRAPGALRLVVARGLETIDLPRYRSLDEFCSAIDRFRTPGLPIRVGLVPPMPDTSVPHLPALAEIPFQRCEPSGSRRTTACVAGMAAMLVCAFVPGASVSRPLSHAAVRNVPAMKPTPVAAAIPAAAAEPVPESAGGLLPEAGDGPVPEAAGVDTAAPIPRPRATTGVVVHPSPSSGAAGGGASPVPDSLQSMIRAAAARASGRAPSRVTAQKRQ